MSVQVHIHAAPDAAANTQAVPQVLGDPIVGAAPDEATPEANIVQAASTIAAAFVLRNFQKRGDGRGQYSLDTIVAMSVDMAEKIHAAVHGTETD